MVESCPTGEARRKRAPRGYCVNTWLDCVMRMRAAWRTEDGGELTCKRHAARLGRRDDERQRNLPTSGSCDGNVLAALRRDGHGGRRRDRRGLASWPLARPIARRRWCATGARHRNWLHGERRKFRRGGYGNRGGRLGMAAHHGYVIAAAAEGRRRRNACQEENDHDRSHFESRRRFPKPIGHRVQSK
jgi:hypothetical protein